MEGKNSEVTGRRIARQDNTNDVAILPWRFDTRFQDFRVGSEVLMEIARYLDSSMSCLLRVADDLQSVLGTEYSIHAA